MSTLRQYAKTVKDINSGLQVLDSALQECGQHHDVMQHITQNFKFYPHVPEPLEHEESNDLAEAYMHLKWRSILTTFEPMPYGTARTITIPSGLLSKTPIMVSFTTFEWLHIKLTTDDVLYNIKDTTILQRFLRACHAFLQDAHQRKILPFDFEEIHQLFEEQWVEVDTYDYGYKDVNTLFHFIRQVRLILRKDALFKS